MKHKKIIPIEQTWNPLCGFVATLNDQGQFHHWYENEEDNPIWICHIPLCDRSAYLLIWDKNECDCYDLIFIPSGILLILHSDVLHGSFIGVTGNVCLHLAFLNEI